jgi:glycosyltransferase involved in cell wall biosynthesis
MPQNNLVSVIIIFLDAEPFLKEAVESVLAQTYTDWELLLVDDGSSDGSSEIALSYASNRPSRIFYLEHEGHQNLGMSAARNLGIRHASGKYIAFLDADDYLLPARLETHVRLLEEYPSVGMLYGSTKYWHSWTGRPEDRQRDYTPDIRIRETTLFDPPQLLSLLLEGKTAIPATCSILVRRDLAEKVGGFEESFCGMYEDQAFYVKICLSERVLAVNDCLSWYRQHPGSHVSTAIRMDRSYSQHYSFLKWAEAYCQSRNLPDKNIRMAIHRQIWLYNNASPQTLQFMSPNRLRWIKKWILRAEEHLLPEGIRTRIWSTQAICGP